MPYSIVKNPKSCVSTIKLRTVLYVSQKPRQVYRDEHPAIMGQSVTRSQS